MTWDCGICAKEVEMMRCIRANIKRIGEVSVDEGVVCVCCARGRTE